MHHTALQGAVHRDAAGGGGGGRRGHHRARQPPRPHHLLRGQDRRLPRRGVTKVISCKIIYFLTLEAISLCPKHYCSLVVHIRIISNCFLLLLLSLQTTVFFSLWYISTTHSSDNTTPIHSIFMTLRPFKHLSNLSENSRCRDG